MLSEDRKAEIEAAARAHAATGDGIPGIVGAYERGLVEGAYLAGATAEAERAAQLVDAAHTAVQMASHSNDEDALGDYVFTELAAALAAYRGPRETPEPRGEIGTLDTFFDAVERRAHSETPEPVEDSEAG
jgi:hypothetical protein